MFPIKFFSKNIDEKNAIFSSHRAEYSEWRDELQEINKPFFMLPNDFKHLFLKDLSGGGLKLYLFLGFHAKYQTGESWYTVEQVATFFEKDPRTVSTWFKELEDKGLIFREQKGYMMRANTFLQPHGFRFDEMETGSESRLEDVLVDVEESKKVQYKPRMALLLNYALKEYTLLLIYQDGAQFHCSCFYDFNENQTKALRVKLKPLNIPIDNYDIEFPIETSKNRLHTLYVHLMKYLDEQSM